MLEQADSAEKLVELSFDNFVQNVLRFAFDLRLVNLAFRFDEIARNVATTDVKRVCRGDVQCDVFNELTKILVPGHEVGLAIHFHEHADLALQVNVRGHDAFLRRPRGFFSRAGDSFHSQNRLRFFWITAALRQSALAIHKASAGLFTELLNQLWVNFHGEADRYSIESLKS